MKHLMNLNEAISGTISIDKLWVVKTYHDTDISTVYASKKTAEKECLRANKFAYDELKKTFRSSDPYDTFEDFAKRNVSKYEVKTLYDAIDDIKDVIREDVEDGYASHGNPSY